MMSIEERIERLIDTNYIVALDTSIVYRIESIDHIGGTIFVNVGRGLLFQDIEILTAKEAYSAERALISIRAFLSSN